MERSRLVETAPAPLGRPLTQEQVVAWIRDCAPAELRALIAALEERLLRWVSETS